MQILIYENYENTTTVGVFSSEEEAQKAIQVFLDAYKKQELDINNGSWTISDEEDMDHYRRRFRMVPAELNQIVDKSVGFIYEWL